MPHTAYASEQASHQGLLGCGLPSSGGHGDRLLWLGRVLQTAEQARDSWRQTGQRSALQAAVPAVEAGSILTLAILRLREAGNQPEQPGGLESSGHKRLTPGLLP